MIISQRDIRRALAEVREMQQKREKTDRNREERGERERDR